MSSLFPILMSKFAEMQNIIQNIEMVILNAKYRSGNILIITSHKLTNIIIADKTILMDKGRIIEIGTKEKLLDTDSEFNKLYSFQINTKEQFL